MNAAKYRYLVLVYCIFVLAVSSIPVEEVTSVKLVGWDKPLHVLEYSVLGWLLIHALQDGHRGAIPIAVVGGVLFGALDETWQRFLGYRSASTLDWAADSAGIILGVLVGRALMARREVRD